MPSCSGRKVDAGVSVAKVLQKLVLNQSGQFSLITAIVGFVIVLVAGGAIDITNNYAVKSKLQTAADSAALSGSSYYSMNDPNPGAKKKIAKATFMQNCDYEFCKNPNVNILDDTVTVSFSGNKPNYFLSMIGKKDTSISVESSAVVTTIRDAMHANVYFVFDISSSLMFPETQAGVDLMEANFEPFGAGGCAFACHADLGGSSGDQVAQSLGVYLREDRMRDEIRRISGEILDVASGNAEISLISFGWNARELVTLADSIDEIDSGIIASDYIESSNGSGTNYETAFADIVNQNMIPPNQGDGTELDPHNIIVLITDGIYNTDSGSMSGATSDRPINPLTCDTIKDTGAELFVLNLTYPDPNNLMVTSANALRIDNLKTFYDQVSSNLQFCASNGRYYEGIFNAEIVQAFESIYDDLIGNVSSEELAVRISK